MQTIIVLIGSINEDAYKGMRLSELQEGNRPQVRRIDSVQLLSEIFIPDDEDDSDHQYFWRLSQEAIEDHFRPFSRAVAVFVDERTYKKLGSATEILESYLERTCPDAALNVVV